MDGNSGTGPTRGAGRSGAEFVTTCWSTVRRAGAEGAEREAALDRLFRQYRPAIKHYLVSRFRFDNATAEDVVQGFLLDKVLKKNLVGQAFRHRGRFRTFLLTSVNRYAVDHFRRASVRRRIPPNALISLESIREGEAVVDLPPVGAGAFDNAFVRQVLAMAVWRLRQWCDAEKETGPAVWQVFYRRVLEPVIDDREAPPYAELVADPELDVASDREARNRLTTAKRVLRRELEGIVADYSNDSAEAREELEELRRLIE